MRSLLLFLFFTTTTVYGKGLYFTWTDQYNFDIGHLNAKTGHLTKTSSARYPYSKTTNEVGKQNSAIDSQTKTLFMVSQNVTSETVQLLGLPLTGGSQFTSRTTLPGLHPRAACCKGVGVAVNANTRTAYAAGLVEKGIMGIVEVNLRSLKPRPLMNVTGVFFLYDNPGGYCPSTNQLFWSHTINETTRERGLLQVDLTHRTYRAATPPVRITALSTDYNHKTDSLHGIALSADRKNFQMVTVNCRTGNLTLGAKLPKAETLDEVGVFTIDTKNQVGYTIFGLVHPKHKPVISWELLGIELETGKIISRTKVPTSMENFHSIHWLNNAA